MQSMIKVGGGRRGGGKSCGTRTRRRGGGEGSVVCYATCTYYPVLTLTVQPNITPIHLHGRVHTFSGASVRRGGVVW